MYLIITILPVATEDLPFPPRFTRYDFLSRCKFSNLATRQPMVEFYLLTFPRFPLRKKEHKFYFGKNRTHDFRITRCVGYLLDHSGVGYNNDSSTYRIHDGNSTNKSSEFICCEKNNPQSPMADNFNKGSKSSDDLENVQGGIQNSETTGSDNVGDDNTVHENDPLTLRFVE